MHTLMFYFLLGIASYVLCAMAAFCIVVLVEAIDRSDHSTLDLVVIAACWPLLMLFILGLILIRITPTWMLKRWRDDEAEGKDYEGK